ncbi:metallophosphoesterase family protein [Deinococcus multiflagellatus]|uniref:metallophosphoesterase family protein n=1 Tax=Deinococcus multiflagellatus TaxID=1656887 RepID=UPI001CCE23AE|nr:metallophosphoesterase family protein [Deinococcus multiflagellatus]MBZ9712080.1 metallophosphatase family protein [Deinococcus multiflagellatus]
MRAAVLADIHGNADALRAVLADAKAQGAERLIVNGDVVNRGPDSVEALELLLGRPDVTFTLGNHDDLLRLWHTRSDALPPDWFADPFWGATEWSAQALDRAGLLHASAAWPMSTELWEPGVGRVLLAHGTAEHYRESLSEQTPLPRVQALRAHGDGAPYDVLVGSHIHRPAHARLDGTLVLNTGAVGAPANHDPRAQYLLLTATPGGWVPTFRAVPYDQGGVLRRFETSGLLRTGLSAEIFREELRTARSLYTPYWGWTEETGTPRTADSWAAFLNTQAVCS